MNFEAEGRIRFDRSVKIIACIGHLHGGLDSLRWPTQTRIFNGGDLRRLGCGLGDIA
jgi:hypothetical protein